MPLTPTLTEVLKDAIGAFQTELMTATIGKVLVYDPVLESVNVQPVIRHAVNLAGETDHEELPVLPNVPVVWPEAGGFHFSMPIRPGDHVLLVFTHDHIGFWRESGTVSDPGLLARHDLSNAIAIPGIRPVTKPLSKDLTHLAARAAGLVMGKDGSNEQIQVNDLGILLGHLATEPVARAPAIVTAIEALAAWAVALQAALDAGGLVPAVATALKPASSTLATALGGAAAAVPSELAKTR